MHFYYLPIYIECNLNWFRINSSKVQLIAHKRLFVLSPKWGQQPNDIPDRGEWHGVMTVNGNPKLKGNS